MTIGLPAAGVFGDSDNVAQAFQPDGRRAASNSQ
jgi:hypothetical protein